MTDTSPLISIIIPVYKVEPYLRQCLDSVLAQTYPHWEAICINDGSPDNCGAILDEYAAKDSRFIVIHQENQGVSVARNKGLKVMQGKYLTFLDSDDWFSPNALECIIETMEKTDAEFGRCSQINHTSSEKSEIYRNGLVFYKKGISYHSHSLSVADRRGFCSSIGGAVFKSKYIIIDSISFSEKAKIGEDLEFIIKYLRHTQTIAYIFSPIYNYRLTSGVCQNLRNNTAKISTEELVNTSSIIYNIPKIKPSKYLNKKAIQGFKAIQLQSTLLVYIFAKMMHKNANVPYIKIFPWHIIFPIIHKSNPIESIRLIIRHQFPIIEITYKNLMNLYKSRK